MFLWNEASGKPPPRPGCLFFAQRCEWNERDVRLSNTVINSRKMHPKAKTSIENGSDRPIVDVLEVLELLVLFDDVEVVYIDALSPENVDDMEAGRMAAIVVGVALRVS